MLEVLTGAEIENVRRSFLTLVAENALAQDFFYYHLFTSTPELREHFTEEILGGPSQLTNMLGMIVSQIHELPSLLPFLDGLAQRHAAYGAEPEHYQLFGEALLKMLRDVLGGEFNAAVETAWSKAYEGIATSMIASSHGPEGLLRYRTACEG